MPRQLRPVCGVRLLLLALGTSLMITCLALTYCVGNIDRQAKEDPAEEVQEDSEEFESRIWELHDTIQELEEQLTVEKQRACPTDINLPQTRPVRTCKEKTNFVFIKMHKSGSETMTSLFHRYGDERMLEFVLPRGDVNDWYLGWPKPITRDIYRPAKSGMFNIMCEHTVFNKPAMSKVMPKDAVYITILREPFEQFKSSFKYHLLPKILGIPENSDVLVEFFKQPETYDNIYTSSAEEVRKVRTGIPDGVSVTRNFMAHDLSYPRAQWENSTYLQEFIKYIDKEFILVMILEYFEESLILLKRAMCWEFQDIIYHPSNVAAYPYKIDRRQNLIDAHRKFSKVDYALYQHFNRTFWEKIKQGGQDFKEELEAFRKIQRVTTRYCDSKRTTPLSFPSTKWSMEVRITRHFCSRYGLDTGGYLDHVLKKRYDGILT
ncbi:PREDICTED: galactosylceramide sulfotransferase-like [Branchiostoma belcheri]|uniref:Galactosylceramide sulfotransferase-like n=1 Tax=Branchiostoma belcheri TaxID=7741 RepID=A0A6P4ZG62_BRABE|nr:PREDICTED: galactosylceramide sulfotransferase-like [Branchiostoma belcheri]